MVVEALSFGKDGTEYETSIELDGTGMMDFLVSWLGTQGQGQLRAERFWAYMAFRDFNNGGEIEILPEAQDAVMLEDWRREIKFLFFENFCLTNRFGVL